MVVHNFYPSSRNTRAIKSRKMRHTRLVTLMR